MECYHYVNIFETKGLEYILVIVFLTTFVLFLRHLRAHAHRPEPVSTPPHLDSTGSFTGVPGSTNLGHTRNAEGIRREDRGGPPA